jgi:hypothetical protein
MDKYIVAREDYFAGTFAYDTNMFSTRFKEFKDQARTFFVRLCASNLPAIEDFDCHLMASQYMF